MQKQLKLENNVKDGFLLINKEAGCTSFDIVKKINKLTNLKAGHCGTLDPFAEGLLILAIGKATRCIEYLLNQDKRYIFEISWGEDTDSHDLTGNIIKESQGIPGEEEVKEAMKSFYGKVNQVPPIFSAIKINGKRAYKYARENKEIELKEREINIFDFKLLSHSNSSSKFKIFCSKGTYIRSIVRDLCNKLNKCGHTSYLKRISIADFSVENSISIKELENSILSGTLRENIITIDQILYFLDSFEVSYDLYSRLRLGCKISIKNLPFSKESIIKLKFNKQFFGIAKYSIEKEGAILRPKKIFVN